jgi:hypothetical protein
VTAQPPADPAWTVEQACEYFAETDIPIKPDRLRLIIRALEWQPVGYAPSPGPQGGRGAALYPVSDLMRLHSALAEWLVARGLRARRPPP